jgi:uncharacterized membrane protein
MTMTAGQRKLLLTTHVVASVGWLGAVASFVALDLVAIGGSDVRRVLSVYVAMDLMTRLIIVPACVASLITGITQSLLTPWGLLRHYWVFFKLGLTVAATAMLLVHLRPIREAAMLAGAPSPSLDDLRKLGVQLVVASGAAVVVLVTSTVLSVYKPRGVLPAAIRGTSIGR